MADRFHGKFLGQVVDNSDPKNVSRIRVRVPEVFGDEETGWCLPCSPYAGPGVGLAAVPPVNSLVFVEWPAGDTTRTPIWSGALWADGDGVSGASSDKLMLLTPGGHSVTLDDSAPSVEIAAASGAKVTLDDNGATVEFGGQKVALTSSSVSINDGALEVM
jgi:type VI secretion system (T6SS) baseplate-like injector VgrG